MSASMATNKCMLISSKNKLHSFGKYLPTASIVPSEMANHHLLKKIIIAEVKWQALIYNTPLL